MIHIAVMVGGASLHHIMTEAAIPSARPTVAARAAALVCRYAALSCHTAAVRRNPAHASRLTCQGCSRCVGHGASCCCPAVSVRLAGCLCQHRPIAAQQAARLCAAGACSSHARLVACTQTGCCNRSGCMACKQVHRDTHQWHISSSYGLFRRMTGVGASAVDERYCHAAACRASRAC